MTPEPCFSAFLVDPLLNLKSFFPYLRILFTTSSKPYDVFSVSRVRWESVRQKYWLLWCKFSHVYFITAVKTDNSMLLPVRMTNNIVFL